MKTQTKSLTGNDLSAEKIQDLVNKFAPVVHLHPDEQFFPASVPWYLENVSLYSKDNKLISETVDETSLSTADSTDYLKINDTDTEVGSYPDAPFYVRFTQVGDELEFYDIEYWFFYAYNGCSSLGVRGEIGSHRPEFQIPIDPFGTHQGDWEHVTVRISASTQELVAIFTAQHSWGSWEKPGQYDVYESGSRPIIYSAYHSHASYVHSGTETIKSINVGFHDFKISAGLLDRTGTGSRVWDPLESGSGVNVISTNIPSINQTTPWATWKGHWGAPPDIAKQIHDAVEILYHAFGHKSHWLKDLSDDVIKVLSKVLPNGPDSPSAQKAWDKGEPTSPF